MLNKSINFIKKKKKDRWNECLPSSSSRIQVQPVERTLQSLFNKYKNYVCVCDDAGQFTQATVSYYVFVPEVKETDSYFVCVRTIAWDTERRATYLGLCLSFLIRHGIFFIFLQSALRLPRPLPKIWLPRTDWFNWLQLLHRLRGDSLCILILPTSICLTAVDRECVWEQVRK